MPVLRPAPSPTAQTGDADASEDAADRQSTEEFEPQDLARLAMATRKKPGSALSGLGGLKSGRRPGSLLQGLPKFRGVGQSPLTSGEFKLGSLGGGSLGGGIGKGGGLGASSLGKGALGSPLNPAPGASDSDAALGLYGGAKRSSLPPEAAPESSLPPTQATPAVATDAADAPTMAMQGVSTEDLADAPADAADGVGAVDVADAGDGAVSAVPGEVGPTMVLQGVTEAEAAAGAGDPLMTAEERLVANIPHAAGPIAATPIAAAAAAAATPVAAASVASASPVAMAAAAASAATPTEPPLPTSMRGSERAHHPGPRGVTQARVDESGGNGKWIVIGVLVLAAIGAAIWFATQ